MNRVRSTNRKIQGARLPGKFDESLVASRWCVLNAKTAYSLTKNSGNWKWCRRWSTCGYIWIGKPDENNVKVQTCFEEPRIKVHRGVFLSAPFMFSGCEAWFWSMETVYSLQSTNILIFRHKKTIYWLW